MYSLTCLPLSEKAISGPFFCPSSAICFSITSAPDAMAQATALLSLE